MSSRLQDVIRKEGIPTKYWEEGCTHNVPFSVPKLYKKELIKSRYTCGLVLCGSHCI
jgi:hypothetical protein